MRIFALSFLLVCSFVIKGQTPAGKKTQVVQKENSGLSYVIINSVNNTYGYDIYKKGKLFIHQTSVPALSTNNGFKTKSAAEKVAQLVIEKIKRGEMPPSVTLEELKKLKALP